MAEAEELPPSRLGTKEHWDQVYERENAVFEDIGDEGEVWFGESSVTKMRQWAVKHLPLSPAGPSSSSSTSSNSTPRLRIMECGAGNGTLLLSFLTSPASVGRQAYDLTGLDYSAGSTRLSALVEAQRREELASGSRGETSDSDSDSDADSDDDDDAEVVNDCTVSWRTVDLLREDLPTGYADAWDLILDKGTYDALCLSAEGVEERGGRLPSAVYPEQVVRVVRPGGFFLITSCNFTQEEIVARWTKPGLGLRYHSSVPHKSFSFGGKTGTTVCTVAFQKEGEIESAGSDLGSGTDSRTSPRGTATAGQKLYICIDCGGTKTDVAIASASGVVVARARGSTGNMAEVGLKASYDVIKRTVREAVQALPEPYQGAVDTPAEAGEVAADRCPVDFADIWVGISGCDTPLDQSRMSELLAPFFARDPASLPILNDAHLLGGALLSHGAPWGIAVIAGTGSVVVGLEVASASAGAGAEAVVQVGRRGGLGYLLGDDGSAETKGRSYTAFDIGRSAIRFAMEDYDSGLEADADADAASADQVLVRAMHEHFGVQTTPEILAVVHDLDPSLSPHDATNARKLLVSSLSHPVLAAYESVPVSTATEQDETGVRPNGNGRRGTRLRPSLAERAVHDAAGRLVSSIVSLVRQLVRTDEQGQAQRRAEDAVLMLGGGVIRQDAYRACVESMLREHGVVFGQVEVVGDVAGEGAVGLSRRSRGA